MIVFAIPLRAKETSKDWEKCVSRFNDTLTSIFNQTCADFCCIVACNEPLDQLNICPSYKEDKRLEYIQVEAPIPQEWIEMARDKFWKLTEIAVRIRRILEQQENPEKGIYVMPVDADDLLSNRIAEWCNKYPDAHGFVSTEGYVWQAGKCYFQIYPEMHTFCGSCNIIKMYLQDLPEVMPTTAEYSLDQRTATILNAKYPIRFNHHQVVDKYKREGKPFDILPFRSTVYVRGTGDNISALYLAQYAKKDKRFHPIAFLRSLNFLSKRLLTNTIKREYGIK